MIRRGPQLHLVLHLLTSKRKEERLDLPLAPQGGALTAPSTGIMIQQATPSLVPQVTRYKLRKDASIRFKSMSDVFPFYSPIFYPAPSECLPVAQIEVNSLVSGAREPLSCAGASETEVIPSDPTLHNFITHSYFGTMPSGQPHILSARISSGDAYIQVFIMFLTSSRVPSLHMKSSNP